MELVLEQGLKNLPYPTRFQVVLLLHNRLPDLCTKGYIHFVTNPSAGGRPRET